MVPLFSGCGRNPGSDISLSNDLGDTETTQVTIYYPRSGELIATYASLKNEKDLPKKALEFLLSLPEKQGMEFVVLPRAEVLSISTTIDTCIINFSLNILDFEAKPEEKKLAWAAITFTAAEATLKNKVKFLIEGKESGKIGGKDISNFWGEITLKNQPWVVK